MKKLFLVCLSLVFLNACYSQCEVIKTNLSTYIKTNLLAPSSFKIHRYSCKQISPPVAKLQADLKKQKTTFKNQQYSVGRVKDSLQFIHNDVSKEIDSLRYKYRSSPYMVEKVKLEAELKALNVDIVPKDQEFLTWMAARGMDTTKAHFAFVYTNQLKNLKPDSSEYYYNKGLVKWNRITNELDKSIRQHSLIEKQIGLIDLYLEETKEFPVYETYIVYQALTKGGSNSLFEETYYFVKGYKCVGNEYSKFWEDLSIIDM